MLIDQFYISKNCFNANEFTSNMSAVILQSDDVHDFMSLLVTFLMFCNHVILYTRFKVNSNLQKHFYDTGCRDLHADIYVIIVQYVYDKFNKLLKQYL